MATRTMTLCRNVFLNPSRFHPITSDFTRNFWSFRKCRDIIHLWPRSRLFGGVLLGVGASIAGAAVAVKQPVFDEATNASSSPSSSAEATKRPKFKPIRKVTIFTRLENCCKYSHFGYRYQTQSKNRNLGS